MDKLYMDKLYMDRLYMDRLSEMVTTSIVCAVGGSTLGFALNREYGGLIGAIFGLLVSLLLWRKTK